MKLSNADVLILKRLGIHEHFEGEEVPSWEMVDDEGRELEGITVSDATWPTSIAGVSIFRYKQ